MGIHSESLETEEIVGSVEAATFEAVEGSTHHFHLVIPDFVSAEVC